jgi:ATP-dependent DNA ligase
MTASFPELQGIWRQIKWNKVVLDGEMVCFDENGLPNFNRIQRRIKNTDPLIVARLARQFPATFVVWDILEANEVDFTSRGQKAPLGCRKQLISECLISSGLALQAPFVIGKGVELFGWVKSLGVEGIVAKELNSFYYPGYRHPKAWLKIKTWQKGIFKVIGYTPGKNAREEYFGALVLGELRDGKLVHVGRAGSGPDDGELRDLTIRLKAMPTMGCPFKGKVNVPKGTVWVDSGISVEVQYLEYSNDGYLVNPSFKKEI